MRQRHRRIQCVVKDGPKNDVMSGKTADFKLMEYN